MIDLRPADAFRAGHLPRARSLPLGELNGGRRSPASGGSCSTRHAREAAAAYRALREAGYRNVMVLVGGLPAWIRLGYPVEVGR